ncbi:MAG: 2-oxoglutarate dehydrogenase complex dihydrolipoyllysine-residue succinyltransferase [Armatimonadetes bacterium]|nr:2-oxoglutarate dehydrogenase complex dihydrolipoyllysine-residue succinyltransferase [Armatimonadota bacterium]
MAVELKVPASGESISEVEIGEWLKRPGDPVNQDEVVVVLETDKAALDVPAPATGVLDRVLKEAGETARPGEVIALIAVAGEAAAPQPAEAQPAVEPPPAAAPAPTAVEAEAPAAAAPAPEAPVEVPPPPAVAERPAPEASSPPPAVAERPAPEAPPRAAVAAPQESAVAAPPPARAPEAPAAVPAASLEGVATPSIGRQEEVVPMTALRRRIAERLVQAQQTAALLTTFNEIDMSAVIALRQELQPIFQERHGVKLGFMSFFVKASIEALKRVPQVNAEIQDENIVYRNYYDIGIAVGGGRGLVVPVLRNAERMSFAEVERAIADFARRAQENKLKIEELQGGTFTISNGGIYGSLLSTPIVNPPQSGVLGMHAIQERPVAREGQVVIRPMMYVALTYDHRLIDGREAVTFLRHIKECIEEPARLLLEV